MIQTIWHLVQKRRNSEARMRSRRDEVHDDEDVELGFAETYDQEGEDVFVDEELDEF